MQALAIGLALNPIGEDLYPDPQEVKDEDEKIMDRIVALLCPPTESKSKKRGPLRGGSKRK